MTKKTAELIPFAVLESMINKNKGSTKDEPIEYDFSPDTKSDQLANMATTALADVLNDEGIYLDSEIGQKALNAINVISRMLTDRHFEVPNELAVIYHLSENPTFEIVIGSQQKENDNG